MHRRRFVRSAATTAAGLMSGIRPAFAADAEVEISPDKPGAEISPHIYGQFIEHLGGVIYDGIWVGRQSKIANIGGIRKQFVDDMKAIKVPNFRWPGGCFADGYHWRDGIGKTSARPRTYNYWQGTLPAGLDHTENNEFGIHEFMNLCRLTDAEPYLAANMGSGSPQEFHDWMQYCNAPVGTVSLAQERAANGSRDPFGVKYWGVGNESWGCGGDMSPQEYATLYRRFVTQLPAYQPRPYLVAVGPRGHSQGFDLDWTNGFFGAMEGHHTPVHGLSVHFYTDFRKSPEKISTFDARGWHDVIREGARVEEVITKHWAAMAKYDPAHRTKLIIDEWGVWYAPGEEINPRYILSQPLTLRDAVHTAVTFDIYNRHADKVAMTNVAQTVNCIHSLFLAEGDRFTRTPCYYVFAMYRGHMGAQVAPMKISASGLSGSASLKEKRLFVTLTNSSLDAAVTARLGVTVGSVSEGRGTVLTHADMTAHNKLGAPETVKPAALPVTVRGNRVEVTLPGRAVAALELVIG